MEKKHLIKFYKDKQKIKLNLKNGKFYTGLIIDLDNNSLIFKDKYGNDLPFSLDSISYIDIVDNKRGLGNGW